MLFQKRRELCGELNLIEVKDCIGQLLGRDQLAVQIVEGDRIVCNVHLREQCQTSVCGKRILFGKCKSALGKCRCAKHTEGLRFGDLLQADVSLINDTVHIDVNIPRVEHVAVQRGDRKCQLTVFDIEIKVEVDAKVRQKDRDLIGLGGIVCVNAGNFLLVELEGGPFGSNVSCFVRDYGDSGRIQCCRSLQIIYSSKENVIQIEFDAVPKLLVSNRRILCGHYCPLFKGDLQRRKNFVEGCQGESCGQIESVNIAVVVLNDQLIDSGRGNREVKRTVKQHFVAKVKQHIFCRFCGNTDLFNQT